MKNRYSIFRRENGIYYSLDRIAKKRNSLNTTDLIEAKRLLNVLNEACQQPAVNLQIAQVYLQHSDPEFGKRTWQLVMDEMGKLKIGETKTRWDVAMKDKSFDHLRTLPLSKTLAESTVFDALNLGSVSTNVFLAPHSQFSPWTWIGFAGPVVPKRQWPKVCFKVKRAIT